MQESQHRLQTAWILWSHLPQLNDWTLSSYVRIYRMTTMEEVIAIMEAIPTVMIETCMLFLMKEGINPIWEDPKNRTGGCFAYKVAETNVPTVWKELSYIVTGESTSIRVPEFNRFVNGITISPKKHFCIIKIWTSTCEARFQSPDIISNEVEHIVPKGCLFKKHSE